MQNNKKESLYARDWFVKAKNDLEAAEILINSDNLQVASFHIQQAIEKYLKGYLLSKGWYLRRIHDLEELLDESISRDADFTTYRTLCQTATEYYTEERYPFLVNSKLNKKEMKDILENTKNFGKEILRKIKK